MTNLEINTIRTRLGSINPRKMQDIRALSEAAYRLLAHDLPNALDELQGKTDRMNTIMLPAEIAMASQND